MSSLKYLKQADLPIESFKSHFVDYTESMSEVQMQKMTVDQCKE